MPRLSIAMQRWFRPNAPRWSAHPRAFMPRPWISSTGEPSRAPQASYAMRTPSLVTISLTRFNVSAARGAPRPHRARPRRNAPRRADRRGRTGRASVTSGPNRTCHGAIANPNGPPGVTATGTIGAVVIAWSSGRGGMPAPRRSHVGASGTATRLPARRHARMSGALALIAPRRRASPPNAGTAGAPTMRRRRRHDAPHGDAEHRRLDDAEAAVGDQHRRTGGRDVLAALDLDSDRRGEQRRHEVDDLRIEPERVDRVPAVEAAGATSCERHDPPDRGRRRAARDQRSSSCGSTRLRRSCHLLSAGRDRDHVGPLEELAQARSASARGRSRPSASTARSPAPVRPWRSCSITCGAIAAPASSTTRDATSQSGPDDRQRHPPAEPHRLPRRGRAGADDVERAVVAAVDRGDHRLGRVVGVQQRERRIGERRHRHHRQAQQPPDRARHVRTRPPARSAARTPARRCAAASPATIDSTSSSDRAVRRARLGHHVFVGHRRRAGSAARTPRARCAPRRTPGCRRARPRSSSRSCTARCARSPTAGSSATRARTRRSARRRSARSPRRTPRAGPGRGDRCGGTPRARSRRRGGTKSTPTTSPAHERCSISCATRVPSSPPMPVISTRSLTRPPDAD